MYTMTRQCTVSMSCNHHMRNLCLLLAQYLLHVLYCTLIYLSPQKYESEVEDIPIKSYKSLYLATARYCLRRSIACPLCLDSIAHARSVIFCQPIAALTCTGQQRCPKVTPWEGFQGSYMPPEWAVWLTNDRGARTMRNRLLRYPRALSDSQTLHTAAVWSTYLGLSYIAQLPNMEVWNCQYK